MIFPTYCEVNFLTFCNLCVVPNIDHVDTYVSSDRLHLEMQQPTNTGLPQSLYSYFNNEICPSIWVSTQSFIIYIARAKYQFAAIGCHWEIPDEQAPGGNFYCITHLYDTCQKTRRLSKQITGRNAFKANVSKCGIHRILVFKSLLSTIV